MIMTLAQLLAVVFGVPNQPAREAQPTEARLLSRQSAVAIDAGHPEPMVGLLHMPAEFNHGERPDAPLVSMLSVSKITSAPARASCWAVDTPITPPPTTATLILEKFSHESPSTVRESNASSGPRAADPPMM